MLHVFYFSDTDATEMSGENVKLFVGNLPLDATHEELNKLFAPYGEINTCSLLRQYAFVTLKGEGAADRYGPAFHHHEIFCLII